MVVEISFSLVFLVSVFTLWYRISRHLPALVTIPDGFIRERLREDFIRLQRRLAHAADVARNALWNFFGKAVWRFHITLLRLDNHTLSFLQRIRAQTSFGNGGVGRETAKDIPARPHVKTREVETKKQRVAADSLGRR